MYNFIFRRQPKSYNSWGKSTQTGKENYKLGIKSSLLEYCPLFELQPGSLYGVVYYFFKDDLGLDADNLSKPVWDCLREILFEDDKQVRLRVAGSFDLSKNDFSILDLSGLSDKLVSDLLEAVENEPHFVYIECGEFTTTMFNFNLAKDHEN